MKQFKELAEDLRTYIKDASIIDDCHVKIEIMKRKYKDTESQKIVDGILQDLDKLKTLIKKYR